MIEMAPGAEAAGEQHPCAKNSMAASPYVLALDLGAAKIGAAVFDLEHRRVGDVHLIPTMAKQRMVLTLMNLKRVAEEARRKAGCEAPPVAVGMGSTGGVDARGGLLHGCEPLTSLQGFAIGRFVREEFGAPLYLENDANCFTLGEALAGAGRGHAVVLGLMLGASFGCGIAINGRVHDSASGGDRSGASGGERGGESGQVGEPACSSLGAAPAGKLPSPPGIETIYARIAGKASLTAKQLGEMAGAGDPQALRAWQEYGASIGDVLGPMAAATDPSICVIGGTAGRRLEWFREPLEQRLREHLSPTAAGRIKVAPSELDLAAGVTGAAKLAFQHLEEAKTGKTSTS
jgi:glucokinase